MADKGSFGGFRVPVDPQDVEATLRALRKRLSESVASGRYTKVRLSYKGKALGPDLPLGVVLASEGLAFWMLSPLAAILVNLGAKAFLDVEFIHEADELVQEGIHLYMDGEMEAAEARYRDALLRRPEDPAALYNLGTLLRVTGRREDALETLRRAAMGPPSHPDVARAAESIERMTTGKKTL